VPFGAGTISVFGGNGSDNYFLLAANLLFVMTNDPQRLAQARRGLEDVLARVALRAKTKKRQSARHRSAE